MPMQSDLRFIAPGLLQGFVQAANQPDRIWHVGLFVNGRLLETQTADRPEAAQPGWPAGHGFAFTLNQAALQDRDRLRLQVLNHPHILCDQGFAALRDRPAPTARGLAFVRHAHGLTLSGVLEDGVTEFPAYEILAMEGERIVGRSRIWRWQHIGDPQSPQGRSVAFDLYLDPDLADGQTHRLHIETSTGLVLEGSPLNVIAWPNRLREGLQARAGRTEMAARRSEAMLDRLLGHSMPLSGYGALYPDRAPLTAPTEGRIGADGQWLRLGKTSWVLCHADAVTPLAATAAQLIHALPGLTDARAVFCDLSVQQGDGSLFPLLFSAFDAERLLEQGHLGLCFALPEAALDADAPSLIALLLNWLMPDGGIIDPAQIWHLPHPVGMIAATDLEVSAAARASALLAALQRPGRLAPGITITDKTKTKASFPALHLQRPVTDRAVSLIVPTRDQGALLDKAVNGLIDSHPGFELDIIIVDNGSTQSEALEVLNRLEDRGARILEYGEGFNYAAINTAAAEHARHDQLCFMNNDVDFPQPRVLEELCGRLTCPDVGAVGPLMLRASDIIQHGGVVLGPWQGAVHAFEDRMAGDPGYGDLLCVASEVSAVTGAFLLTRRALFQQMGGFDAKHFAVNFNDVDYCLRLRAAGYRVVVSPHVAIRHYESVSRGQEIATPAGLRMQRELSCLREIWRDTLLNDPQYHPLFALDSLPYRALSADHPHAPGLRRAGGHAPRPVPGWL